MDYAQAQKKLSELDIAIEALKNQIHTHKDRDKTGLLFRGQPDYHKPNITGSHWQQAHISFNAYHGFYGNSSCREDMSPDVAFFVVKALNALTDKIVEKAVQIAEEQKSVIAVKIRKEAEKIIELVKD